MDAIRPASTLHNHTWPGAIYAACAAGEPAAHQAGGPCSSSLSLPLQTLYDLLSPTPGAPDALHILEERDVTFVRGLTEVPVHSEEQALACFFEGEAQAL